MYTTKFRTCQEAVDRRSIATGYLGGGTAPPEAP
jgi:hypothetical protein